MPKPEFCSSYISLLVFYFLWQKQVAKTFAFMDMCPPYFFYFYLLVCNLSFIIYIFLSSTYIFKLSITQMIFNLRSILGEPFWWLVLFLFLFFLLIMIAEPHSF